MSNMKKFPIVYGWAFHKAWQQFSSWKNSLYSMVVWKQNQMQNPAAQDASSTRNGDSPCTSWAYIFLTSIWSLVTHSTTIWTKSCSYLVLKVCVSHCSDFSGACTWDFTRAHPWIMTSIYSQLLLLVMKSWGKGCCWCDNPTAYLHHMDMTLAFKLDILLQQ